MAKGKAITNTIPIGSIEAAVMNGEWASARLSMAVKLARMMDNTDCARDIKSLSLSLDPLLDKCEADAQRIMDKQETPYAQIMREAEAALANA